MTDPRRHEAAVAVISKIPRPGRTKTRLARTLGAPAALALHRAFVADELSGLDRPEQWQLYLVHDAPADDTDRAELDDLLRGTRARPLAPDAGSLAGDLLGAFEVLLTGHERAVIVSGDVPQLTADRVHEALSALDRADAVIGAGPHGGFYLIGMREPHDLFSPVTQGADSADGATVALARPRGLSVASVAPLADIDEAQDLLALEHAPAGTAVRSRQVVAGLSRGDVATALPSELQIEVTNLCNLHCTACLRTHADLGPDADLTLDDYRDIVKDLPRLDRVTFQLNGEAMLATDLHAMVAEAAAGGAWTVLNTTAGAAPDPRTPCSTASTSASATPSGAPSRSPPRPEWRCVHPGGNRSSTACSRRRSARCTSATRASVAGDRGAAWWSRRTSSSCRAASPAPPPTTRSFRAET